MNNNSKRESKMRTTNQKRPINEVEKFKYLEIKDDGKYGRTKEPTRNKTKHKKAGKFRKILILWTKFGGKWERKGQFFSCSEGDR